MSITNHRVHELSATQSNEKLRAISALILVPTRELAGQVSKVLAKLTAFCSKDIKCLNLADSSPDSVQRALLADLPDVVIATPGRANAHSNSGALDLSKLAHLVVDEADLILSYGYEQDLRGFSGALPDLTQIFLMSATLAKETEMLKGLFCSDPLLLTIDDEEDEKPISQYAVKCVFPVPATMTLISK